MMSTVARFGRRHGEPSGSGLRLGLDSVRPTPDRRPFLILLFVIIPLHVALNISAFFPPIHLLNQDLSFYNVIGKHMMARLWNDGPSSLMETFPPFAWNPLVAIVYGIIYIPIHKQTFWLIISESIMRGLLVSFLWLNVYLISREVRELARPIFLIGLVFVSPIFPNIVDNSSDGLFSIMSGLAFWSFLRFSRTNQLRSLALSSFLTGFAALSRVDGHVLFLVLVALAVIMTVFFTAEQTRRVRRAVMVLCAASLPFLMVTGGYLALQFSLTGTAEIGSRLRTYLVFEMGEGFVPSNTKLQAMVPGIMEARRLYGTAEENGVSFIRAIERNPQAFMLRMWYLPGHVAFMASSAYGVLLVVPLLGLALLGLWSLLRRRLYVLALICLMWPASAVLYIFFYFRPGYFLHSHFIVVMLAAIGGTWLYTAISERRRVYLSIVLLGVVMAIGIVAGSLYVAIGALIGVAVCAAIWIYVGSRTIGRYGAGIILASIIGAALILRGPYPPLRVPTLGASGEEQATRYMATQLPRGTRVGAFGATVIWMAKMELVPLSYYGETNDVAPPSMDEGSELAAWVDRTGVEAIYMDFLLKELKPEVYRLIEERIGRDFVEVFSIDDRSVERAKLLADYFEKPDVETRYRIVMVKSRAAEGSAGDGSRR